MDEMVKLKSDETQRRWLVAIKDKALNSIRELPLLETHAQQFLRVMEAGKVSPTFISGACTTSPWT